MFEWLTERKLWGPKLTVEKTCQGLERIEKLWHVHTRRIRISRRFMLIVVTGERPRTRKEIEARND